LTKVNNFNFISKGRTIKDKGWLALYNTMSTDDKDDIGETEEAYKQVLPIVNKGDVSSILTIDELKKFTLPPSKYTEKSLLRAMETCNKNTSDENIDNVLKGFEIGTQATRAEVMKKIQDAGYVIKKGKSFSITDEGIKLVEIFPVKELMDTDFTGKLEYDLKRIEDGALSREELTNRIIHFTKEGIEKRTKIEGEISMSKEDSSLGICPECGSSIIEGKKGYGCSNWKNGCKFTIWKENKLLATFKKKLTATLIKQLLKNRKANVKGLVSPKTNTKFDCEVILVKESSYWNIKLNYQTKDSSSDPIKSEKTSHLCPSCKKGYLTYVETEKFTGWGCEKWKDGCKLTIPSVKCGVNIDNNIFNDILNKGQTEVLTFTSQNNKSFPARLIIKNGKLDMDFIN